MFAFLFVCKKFLSVSSVSVEIRLFFLLSFSGEDKQQEEEEREGGREGGKEEDKQEDDRRAEEKRKGEEEEEEGRGEEGLVEPGALSSLASSSSSRRDFEKLRGKGGGEAGAPEVLEFSRASEEEEKDGKEDRRLSSFSSSLSLLLLLVSLASVLVMDAELLSGRGGSEEGRVSKVFGSRSGSTSDRREEGGEGESVAEEETSLGEEKAASLEPSSSLSSFLWEGKDSMVKSEGEDKEEETRESEFSRVSWWKFSAFFFFLSSFLLSPPRVLSSSLFFFFFCRTMVLWPGICRQQDSMSRKLDKVKKKKKGLDAALDSTDFRSSDTRPTRRSPETGRKRKFSK